MGILKFTECLMSFQNSTHLQYTALSIPLIHGSPTHHILNTINDQDEVILYNISIASQN